MARSNDVTLVEVIQALSEEAASEEEILATMQQSSGVMTWSEGAAALLTFGIITFLLWV